jgi:hypothetical protein
MLASSSFFDCSIARSAVVELKTVRRYATPALRRITHLRLNVNALSLLSDDGLPIARRLRQLDQRRAHWRRADGHEAG